MYKNFFLYVGISSAAFTASAQKPNILLIVSDDQSAAHVGCYGNRDIKTPHIDSLASHGVIFNRAYCASPQSVPARASIFTGRSPVAVDMTRFNVTLDKEFKTFPEYLRESGYYVGVVGRNYHMDGWPDGKLGKIKEVEEYYENNGYKTFHNRMDTCMVIPNERIGKNHVLINEQFKDFMGFRDKTKPFFLELCYSDPHRPYDAPKVHNPETLKLPVHYPDTKLVKEDLAAYYDEIYRLDSDIGEIMKYLNENGLSENTLIVFTGDNGGAQFMGKGTLYEYGVNIPLIFIWPGHFTKGKVINQIVSHEDLAPTFLSVSGLSVPENMTGKNLLPTLQKGEKLDRKYVFSMRGCHATNSLPVNTSVFDQSRCIIGERYKLIYNILPDLQFVPVDFAGTPMFKELITMNNTGKLETKFRKLYFSEKRPMFELYDLGNDPREQNNLIDKPEYKEIQKELILELTYHMIRDRDFVTLPHAKAYE